LLIIFSLVAGAASISVPHLGEPSSPVDSTISELLTNFGDHLLQDGLTKALIRGEQPSFLARVPAHTRHMLGLAFSELYCVEEHALTMAYLNGTSPHSYPDQRKRNRAIMLYTTPELLDNEIDRVSSAYATEVGQALGVI
jgi:hypothetical protein